MESTWASVQGTLPECKYVLGTEAFKRKNLDILTVATPQDADSDFAIDLSEDTWRDQISYRLRNTEKIKIHLRIGELQNEIRELKGIVENLSETLEKIDITGTAQTTIYNIGSSEYELKVPLDVIIKFHKDEVVSLFPELELHAEGANEFEAISNLKMEILDLFDDLNEMSDDELGEAPKNWKKTLNLLVKKCQ